MNLTKVEVVVEVGSTGFQPVRDIENIRQRAYEIMKDMERYPEYMESVKSVKILEQDKNRVTTHWEAELDGAPINWVQKVRMEEKSQEMTFEAIEGDFDVFRGKWCVFECDKRVCLKLLIEYRLGIPVIEEVLGPILEEKVRNNSKDMLEAIVKQMQISTPQQTTDNKQ